MQIVYSPAGGEEQVFEVEWDDLDLEEMELIERYSGKSYEQMAETFQRGKGFFGLLRPLLYVYLRRQAPEDKPVFYRDVKPKMREVQFRPSLAELLSLRDAVQADPNYPGRAKVLEELADDIAEAQARGESGKAEASPTPATSGNRASRRAGKRTASSST